MSHTIKESIKALVGIETSPTDAIHLLKEDHRKVEGLFKEFDEARTKTQKQKLIKQIVTELTVHAALEEKFIYPRLGFEGDKTKEAYEEHHLVKMSIAELDKMTGSEDNARAKVKVLAEMVKHHIKEEEHDLLPSLKHDGNDLDKIGTAMIAAKQK
ncbi:MAG: hemerythrin domain-containing protein [Candidatus Obscuribacterales bacterium]|nr:hemerythrin domain-containing protein [Candidatus Obscuribacterales bacterium]